MPSLRRMLGLKKSRRDKPEKDNPDFPLAPTGNLVKVFKELDCPICFNTCVPPIHSCMNGHIICNTCRNNVKRCPSCRHGFSGTRNFFAENFITNCSQSCRFSEDGCEFLRLRGDNMKPHESQCMFRAISCFIPNCGQEVPYKSLLSHLTFNHEIQGTDSVPAKITFHADQPIVNNKKWLPYSIQAFDNVFYVMMEVIRPNFWVWIWLQTTKVEDSFESLFTAQIIIKNDEKNLKLVWEGPVHSVRTSDKMIMKDGLCFVVHEAFLQHFNSNGYFTFTVDITKIPRRNIHDLNDLSETCIANSGTIPSRSILYNFPLNDDVNNNNSNSDITDYERSDSFVYK